MFLKFNVMTMAFSLETGSDGVPKTSAVMAVFKKLTDGQLCELVRLMDNLELVSLEELVSKREATRGKISKIVEGIGVVLGRHRTEDQELRDVVVSLRSHIEGLVLNVVVNGNKPDQYNAGTDRTAVKQITNFLEVAGQSMPSADYTKRLATYNSRPSGGGGSADYQERLEALNRSKRPKNR